MRVDVCRKKWQLKHNAQIYVIQLIVWCLLKCFPRDFWQKSFYLPLDLPYSPWDLEHGSLDQVFVSALGWDELWAS